MKAVDSQGFQYSFAKGGWHPTLAKDAGGNLFKYHEGNDEWTPATTEPQQPSVADVLSTPVQNMVDYYGNKDANANSNIPNSNAPTDTLSTNVAPGDGLNHVDTRGGFDTQQSSVPDAFLPNADGSIPSPFQPKPQPQQQPEDPLTHGIKMMYAGYMSSGAGTAHDAANFAAITSKIIQKTTGMNEKNAADAAQVFFREQEKAMATGIEPNTIPDKINYAVGAVPGYIARLLALGQGKIGMAGAMAVEGGLSESDKGFIPALEGAARGALTGIGLGAAGALAPVARTAASAAVGAAADPQDPVGGAVTMGVLGGVMGGKGGRTTLGVLKDAKDAYVDPVKGAAKESIKTKFAPTHGEALLTPNDTNGKQFDKSAFDSKAEKGLVALAKKEKLTAPESREYEHLARYFGSDTQAILDRYGIPKTTEAPKPQEATQAPKQTEPPVKADTTPSSPPEYKLTAAKKVRAFKTIETAQKMAGSTHEVVDHPDKKGMYALKKKEQRIATPVTESQVPSPSEQGDAGVAPGRAGGVPENTSLNRIAERYTQIADQAGKHMPFAIAMKNARALKDAIEHGTWTDLLHPDNKVSRHIFTEITGVKLPLTVKGTREAVANVIKTESPEKPAQKTNERNPANASRAPEGKAKRSPANASEGTASEVPDHHISPEGLKLHELVELNRLLTGSNPRAKSLRASLHGYMRGRQVVISRDLAADPKQALKTLAHEIGHVIGWIDGESLKLGNILGHVANIGKYMKHYMESSPNAKEGILTPDDIRRLKSEAKNLAKLGAERLLDKHLKHDYKVTPKDIMDIWNSVDNSDIPGLADYIKRLPTREKKAIIVSAMKGMVPEQVKAIVRAANDMEAKVKPDGSDMNWHDTFTMLLKDEIARRRLFSRDTMMNELKAVTMEWNPFTRGKDASYDKYRDKPAELYADALSMYFNNPEMLARMAPEFWRGFQAYADRRPKAMFAIRKVLKARGMSLDRLQQHIEKGFAIAEENRNSEHERVKRLSSISLKDIKHAVFDRYAPILDLVSQVSIKDGKNPAFAIEALTHVNTRNEGYLAAFTRAFMKLNPDDKVIRKIGLYMLSERVLGEHKAGNDRFAVGGIEHEQAVKIIAGIDKEYPDVKAFTKEYRKIRQEWIMDVMKKSGLYSKSMLKSFEREEGHYATFKNAAFIDAMDKLYTGGQVRAHIKQRLGSFGAIENPLMATLAQDITMLVAAERNHVVRKTVDMLKEHFKDAIEPASIAWNGKKRTFTETHPKADKQLVLFMEDGRERGFYVSRDIARALKDPKRHDDLNVFVNFLATKLGRAVKVLFTEANPGFWVRNVIRDYARAATNLPGANAVTLAPYALKAIRQSLKSGFGKDSPLIEKMLKDYELISVADYRSLNEQDGQLFRLLARFHVSPSDLSKPKSIKGKTAKYAKKAWFYYSGVARGLERIPKVAGRMYLAAKRPDMSPEMRRHILLGQVGSPDFLRAGSEMHTYNSILLFGNAIKEGIRSDIEVIRDRPVDYFFNAFTLTYLPRMAMLMTAAGFFGDDRKAIMQEQTTYDKQNYTLIPVGVTEKGEGVAISLALDPMQKFQANLFEGIWRGMTTGDKKEFLKSMGTTFATELPGFTPVMGIWWDIGSFIENQQQLDYRGRPIYSRAALAQAPVDSSKQWVEFLTHLWNTYGGSMLMRIRNSDMEGDKSKLDRALGIPLLGGVGRAVLSIANYGKTQTASKAIAKVSAIESLSNSRLRKAIINILEGKDTPADEQVIMNSPATDTRRIMKAISLSKSPPLERLLYKIRNDPKKVNAALKALGR